MTSNFGLYIARSLGQDQLGPNLRLTIDPNGSFYSWSKQLVKSRHWAMIMQISTFHDQSFEQRFSIIFWPRNLAIGFEKCWPRTLAKVYGLEKC